MIEKRCFVQQGLREEVGILTRFVDVRGMKEMSFRQAGIGFTDK